VRTCRQLVVYQSILQVLHEPGFSALQGVPGAEASATL